MENQSGPAQSVSGGNQSPSVASGDHGDEPVWTRLDSNQQPPNGAPSDLLAPNSSESTGTVGASSPEPVGLLLDLEDRLLVALSARGDRRIGEFIEAAFAFVWPRVFEASDEEFVAVLERFAGEARP